MQVQVNVSRVSLEPADRRRTVTLHEVGTPWAIRLQFALVGGTETGSTDWVNVGFELSDDAFASEWPASTSSPDPLDAVTLQRISANYGSYLEIARHALVLEFEGMAGAIERLRGPGRKPARLTDDFYRLIAAEYETHRQAGGHPGKELAAKYRTHPGNVSKWLKVARKRGFIDEKGQDDA